MKTIEDVEKAFREKHPEYGIKIDKFIGGVFISVFKDDQIAERPYRYRLDYFDMDGLYNCAELQLTKHKYKFGG